MDQAAGDSGRRPRWRQSLPRKGTALGIAGVAGSALATVGASWAVDEMFAAPNAWHAVAAFGCAVSLAMLVILTSGSGPKSARGRHSRDAGRSRGLVLGGGALVACSAAALAFALSPAPGKTAPRRTDVLFRSDFNNPDSGLPVGRLPTGTEEYRGGQYEIDPQRGYAVWVPAPTLRVAAAERLIADAEIVQGEGGWGLWCRGTTSGLHYEFSVTHAGYAYIKTPEIQTKPRKIPSFDAYTFNRVEADCSDAVGNAGVQLTLKVNGRTVVSYLDHGHPVLGPGQVGFHAFSFGDVQGTTADVRFQSFEVDRMTGSN